MLDSLDMRTWPEEAIDKMPDRSRCRRRCSLAELQAVVEKHNTELRTLKQPPLETDELTGARLYSKPSALRPAATAPLPSLSIRP